MPIPFECETQGTTKEPMLGVAVSVTPGVVAELLMTMESSPSTHDVRPQAIQAVPHIKINDVLLKLDSENRDREKMRER